MIPITPAEFKKRIVDYAEMFKGDPEAFHAVTDNLMEVILRDLGYGEGIEILEKQTRWAA